MGIAIGGSGVPDYFCWGDSGSRELVFWVSNFDFVVDQGCLRCWRGKVDNGKEVRLITECFLCAYTPCTNHEITERCYEFRRQKVSYSDRRFWRIFPASGIEQMFEFRLQCDQITEFYLLHLNCGYGLNYNIGSSRVEDSSNSEFSGRLAFSRLLRGWER